jgi:hypothetical protein
MVRRTMGGHGTRRGDRVRHYGVRPVTVEREILVAVTCDGCGAADTDVPGGLIPVVIEVNVGEEMGSRDEYDYCDDCIRGRAAALVAAGSRAPLVTGVDVENPGGDRG